MSNHTVTPDMLDRPISEASVGEVFSVISLLLESSGMMQPYHPPSPVSPVGFPPSPCNIATHAAFMSVMTRSDTTAKEHWLEIWKHADALCSGT
jgi:hypothetical protein